MKKINCWLVALSAIAFLASCNNSANSGRPVIDINPMVADTKSAEESVVAIVDKDVVEPVSGEKYANFEENPFIETQKEKTSTFAIDADGAAYSNLRRYITNNEKPPKDAIRIEELINYFNYKYPDSKSDPIAADGEVAACPWAEGHKLVRIGVKGKNIPDNQLPASNVVLLVDVSGSMEDENKLALLKNSFKYLVNELKPDDKLAIVTYAGESGVVLPATSGAQKDKIMAAINGLGAGGSTAGADGIITAYKIAQENYVKNGNNRVILCTDGDFNVGPASNEELIQLIEQRRELGIFLTVIGVGEGNLNDAGMEALADHGNGIYEYIDNMLQAKKVFSDEKNKFFTVGKDVKIQIDFSPEYIKSYRLIGYENRKLNKEDFTNDKKDAGDISSGQTVTALYEVIPNGATVKQNLLEIRLRYKDPLASVSKPLTINVTDFNNSFEGSSENLRFAAAVAAYGMLVRDSPHKGNATYTKVKDWASKAMSYDPNNLRKDFLQLIDDTSKAN